MSAFRSIFTLVLLACSLRLAEAIQLGDTRQEIEARYDTAPIGDNQKRIAIYRWDLWKLEIQYSDDVKLEDVAKTLIYSKLDPVTDDEAARILNQNGGLANWHASGFVQGRPTAWSRTDGATASLDAKGLSMTLHGGKMPVATPTPVPAGAAATAAAVATPVKVVATPTATPAPAPVVKKEAPAPKAVATPPGILPKIVSANSRLSVVNVIIGLIIVVFYFAYKSSRKKASQKDQSRPFSEGSKPLSRALYMVPTLETLSWQQFELLMGEVFRRQGYEVEISSGDGEDGGVDLRLKKAGALVVAQCKQYLSGKVSVGAVREFYGVMTSENAARGIFINTSVYTQDCYNFVRDKELELLDGEGVKGLIASVTQPGENIYDIQRWVEEFTANAVVRHPDCQFCKSPMVLREGPRGRFWGCPTYPECKGTRDARMELVRDLVLPGK